MPLLARLGEKRASPDETMDHGTDLSKDLSKFDHRKAKFTPHISEYVLVVSAPSLHSHSAGMVLLRGRLQP